MWEGEGWASPAFYNSSAGVSDKGEVQGLVSFSASLGIHDK